MKSRYVDPFTPDLPISDPSRFSGRIKQVNLIVDSLFQLKNGNPTSTIITGDRGIGKSSLLNQTKELAIGDNRLAERLNLDLGTPKYDFVVAWHDAAKDQGPKEITSGLLENLQSVLKNLFTKVRIEINLAGALKVGQRENDIRDITGIVNQFCSEIEKVASRATEHGKDGVLLFIDELDRVDPRSGIASFFKLTIEKLSREKVTNVAFFLRGNYWSYTKA
ncbi:MAG: ATP-binding protein [Gammaproteobacteria bacterium]